jgi:hypothetical protein
MAAQHQGRDIGRGSSQLLLPVPREILLHYQFGSRQCERMPQKNIEAVHLQARAMRFQSITSLAVES